MLLRKWPFIQRRQPTDTTPASKVKPGGPGHSKTPSFSGIGDEFASKCRFSHHDQRWMMKKVKEKKGGQY
jgi:hypothetical protein